jgi:hypothetical protein
MSESCWGWVSFALWFYSVPIMLSGFRIVENEKSKYSIGDVLNLNKFTKYS